MSFGSGIFKIYYLKVPFILYAPCFTKKMSLHSTDSSTKDSTVVELDWHPCVTPHLKHSDLCFWSSVRWLSYITARQSWTMLFTNKVAGWKWCSYGATQTWGHSRTTLLRKTYVSGSVWHFRHGRVDVLKKMPLDQPQQALDSWRKHGL